MTLTIDISENKCWTVHRWKTVRDTGCNKYQECKDCDSRRVVPCNLVYQPVDIRWLLEKTKG